MHQKYIKELQDIVVTHLKEDEEEVKEAVIGDIVQENVTAKSDENYQEKQQWVTGVEEETSPIEVSQKKATLEKIVSQNRKFDPRYDTLSEKIEDIIQRWNQDVIESDEANRRLEEIHSEMSSLQEEIENSELSKEERALKSVMVQDEFGLDAGEAEQVAVNILENFETNPPSTRKWWTKAEKRQVIERDISEELYDVGVYSNQELEIELLKTLVQLKQS